MEEDDDDDDDDNDDDDDLRLKLHTSLKTFLSSLERTVLEKNLLLNKRYNSCRVLAFSTIVEIL